MLNRNKLIILMATLTNSTSIHAQDTMDYSLPIEIKASLEEASKVLFDFKHYPAWNSILAISGNENLEIGKKFKVRFKDSKGKIHAFKAELIHKGESSFVAQQNILFGWILKATHHFVLEDIDPENIKFTQHFELSGWLGRLMRKQILESLIVFEQMNEDFKNYIQ